MPLPVSKEVARQMFEDAPPGSPELEEATKAWMNAVVRELVGHFVEDEDD